MARHVPTLTSVPFRFWLPGLLSLLMLAGGTGIWMRRNVLSDRLDRKSTRLNSSH